MTDETVAWMLVGIISGLGIIGGYFQIMLFLNTKKMTIGVAFLGEWVFNTDVLNEDGKYYRKAVFLCWTVGIILMVLLFAII